MATKRIRISKREFSWAYCNRMRRAGSSKEVEDIARQRDKALYRPVRKPVVKHKAAK